MNERIKEIYLQTCGKDWVYDFDVDKAEKFAELIVKECLNLVGNEHCPNYAYLAISKHFGVQ